MRTYTWDEYYEKFYDWAESTRVRNLSGLTGVGCADEVAEIIIELHGNLPAADRLLKKAVEAKLQFAVDELIEFLCNNDEELATAAVYNSARRLKAEDMEYLYGEVDDEVIIEICEKYHLTLPEDLREEEEEIEDDDGEDLAEAVRLLSRREEDIWLQEEKPGIKGHLFAIILGLINGGKVRKRWWQLWK